MDSNFAKRNFSFDQIPDLTGKVAIITGSNTGIGKVCALEMARKGCTVVFACRNREKTKGAIEEIKSETKNDKLEFIELDLLDLASVKNFADQFLARYDQLHILMNNAGVMFCPFGLSKDGIETQFATNHVAHYYLTMLLLPVIKKTVNSRIVNVSSIAHIITFRGLGLENINDPKNYNRYMNYGKSKACNILFTRELAKRLEEQGVRNVYVNASYPGLIKTNLYQYFGSWKNYFMNIIWSSPEDGALTQLYLATSPEVEEKNIKGKYYVPFAVLDEPRSVSAAKDEPAKLWEFTEKLLQEKLPTYDGAPI